MSLTLGQIEQQYANKHDNLQPNIYAACGICLVSAYLAVALRLVSRRIKRLSLGGDDYTILVALVFTTAFVSLCIFDTTEGMGRHAILMKPEDFVSLSKGMFSSEVIYVPALMATKISILLLYRRIFTSRNFRIVLWCAGGFVVAFAITSIFLQIFQCVPVQAIWSLKLHRYCINISASYIAMGTINIVTDVMVLCLPMPQLWNLQMSWTRKAQLMGVFLLGGFVCIVSIIRLTYLKNVSLSDATWNDAFTAMWSIVETCMAIVCACLPTLRPLFERENKSAPGSAFTGSGSSRTTKHMRHDAENGSDWVKLTGVSSSSGRSMHH